jgi:hypothetical protein
MKTGLKWTKEMAHKEELLQIDTHEGEKRRNLMLLG